MNYCYWKNNTTQERLNLLNDLSLTKLKPTNFYAKKSVIQFQMQISFIPHFNQTIHTNPPAKNLSFLVVVGKSPTIYFNIAFSSAVSIENCSLAW